MSDERDLDREIAAALGGDAEVDGDRVVLWLAAATRSTPPPALTARIERVVAENERTLRASDRPSRLVAITAAALAVAFVAQGGGSLFAGRWIARGIGETYGAHTFFELGLATIAAGVCAAAAAVSRSWAPVSVLTCTPLATALAVHGVGEFGQFAAGAALHTLVGLLGLVLLGAWLADLRDSRRRRREEGA
jgi:MFS family permease